MTVEGLVDMLDCGVIDGQRIFDFHGAMIEVYEGKKIIGGSLEKHHLGNFRYRTVKNWSLELGNLPTLRILTEPKQITEGES